MNPCTLGWYLPILVKDVPGALQPSDDGGTGSAKWTTDMQIPNSQPSQRPSTASDRETNRLADHGGVLQAGSSTQRTRPSHPISLRMGLDGSSSDDSERHQPRTSSLHPSELQAGRPGPSEDDRGGAGDAGNPGADESGPVTGALTWKDLDSKFRRDLPDDAYVGRLVYRGLVMRACPAIRILDGVETSDKEREKAERILKEVISTSRESKNKGDKDKYRPQSLPTKALTQ